MSGSTIRRRLSEKHSVRVISVSKSVVVLMDATYWGRNFVVVAFKDSRTKKILWRKFITKKETLADYKEGVDWLEFNGFKIEGLVCDGLRGMFQEFSRYKVQMCQFYQIQIVKRYLTLFPKLEASKELLSIAKLTFSSGVNCASAEFVTKNKIDRCPLCGIALDENGVCPKCGYKKQ